MFNNSVKFFLIFLSLCTTSLTYGMEENNHPSAQYDPNVAFANTISNICNWEASQSVQEVIQELDKSLQQGADIDHKFNLDSIEQTAINHVFKFKPCFRFFYQDRTYFKILFNYLIEQNPNLNILYDDKTLPYHLLGESNSSFDRELFEKLLICGTNPKTNFAANYLTTLLFIANSFFHNSNTMKLLIKYGADPEDKTNNGFTLLGYTISASENVKELCKLKVSLTNLDNQGNSVFHFAIANQISPEKIKAILTNARFDSKEIDDEELEQTVKTALLVFERLKISKDIQYLVFSELASRQDMQGFNQKLSRFLYSKGHSNYLLTQAKKRKEKFSEIIEFKNVNGQSVLDLLSSLLANPDEIAQQYAQSIRPLITGEQYDHDIAKFKQKKGNVSKENLVLAPLYN